MIEVASLEDYTEQSALMSGFEHLIGELEVFDLYLKLKISIFYAFNRKQESYVAPSPGFISTEEVLWLMGEQGEETELQDEHQVLAAQLEQKQQLLDQKISSALEQGHNLPLVSLARLFNLSRFEVNILIACIAPELSRRYDKIYAYLQDDITRKKPSIDLVMELFGDSPEQSWKNRLLLEQNSNLIRFQLIEFIDDKYSPSGSSGLARFITINPRILNYLMGSYELDRSLITICEVACELADSDDDCFDKQQADRVINLVRTHRFSDDSGSGCPLLLHMSGNVGSGRLQTATRVCDAMGLSLLKVDSSLLMENSALESFESKLTSVLTESLLLQMPVYFENAETLLGSSQQKSLFHLLRLKLEQYGWLYFIAANSEVDFAEGRGNLACHRVHCKLPEAAQRLKLWKSVFLQSRVKSPKVELLKICADRFQLSAIQIKQACHLYQSFQLLDTKQHTQAERLLEACRQVSSQSLAKLSTKIAPKYQWQDIVLPEHTLLTLKTICNQIAHNSTVFSDWGFAQKLPYGRGLSVMFSGVPGTGKTMASQVIAKELGLELYKIDLSTVVSKYIGETEKNLRKVFDEATTSNAILFFDEADALFGKRTEISDSHDRYANLEVSYLLQRMEEYDGIVILATNLRNNMDEAFVRRIRFIVEFPFPDKHCRNLIWQKSFPKQAPVAKDVDFDILAKGMTLAGGSIKNIALNAAFNAAANGGVITMIDLIESARIEYSKIGKLWDENIYVPPSGDMN